MTLRGAAFACLLLMTLPLGIAQAGSDAAPDEVASPEDDLVPTALLSRSAHAPPPPTDPQAALVDAVDRFYALLGMDAASGATLAAADLPDAAAGRVALLLDALHACTLETQALRSLLGEDPVGTAAGATPDDPRGDGIRSCAASAWQALGALELELQASQAAAIPSVDLWPVLRWEGDPTKSHEYRFDYILQIDSGGDDVYYNNAGSNLIDLKRSPLLDPPLPAQGCQTAIPGILAADCVPLAAVVLDQAGDDVYGVFQFPDVDSLCTPDLVIRRMMTGGAGFAGVGILRDLEGNDQYNGKTVSLGAGHIFGVGVLSDAAGNDVYRSVRNSQGFALVGGLGLLHDQSGADDYGWYMPSALSGGADPLRQEPGSGGVIDDEGLCDSIPRMVQGAGTAGGVGVLVDGGGSDFYAGATTPDFAAPIVGGQAKSQGFGIFGGIGVLVDSHSPNDQYTGVSGRTDNRVLLPGEDDTGASLGAGLFVDVDLVR